jgi:hypothetical protein
MARVDLQCGCGHMFFVGDAQLKAPGGVKCPACAHPVKAPAGAGAAKPGAPKAAPRKPAAAPEPEGEAEEEVDFDALPEEAVPSKTKLYVVGGVIGAVVLGVIVTLILVLKSPSVDYEKEAQKAEEARRKAFEEISSKGSGKASAPVGSTPAAPATPVTPKAPRSTEFKPMPSAPTPPPTTPAATPGKQGSPSGTPAAPSGVVLSADMVGRVKADVLALHPFYLGLVLSPAEKARLDGIAASGRGVPDDADFMQALLTGSKLKAVRDEVALIVQTLPTLERESQENLPVDRITLVESGRVMNCKILDEGAEVLKVSRTLASGVGGQMPIRREAISRIEKGKGIGTEFATRWEAAQKGTLASQVELLSWCKDNTLTGQAKLVAFTILRADPSNTLARTEAGFPADPVKQAEEIAKGGLIMYQGKNWNPKQLRDKFVADGFCLLDGRWYSKKDKMIVVPGLFRYERQQDKPVNFTGLTLVHDQETVYKQVQDVGTGQFIEQSELRLLRRFYSPEMIVGRGGGYPAGFVPPVSTAELDIRVEIDVGIPPAGTKMSGEVMINVPVGGTILEASVITTAEVKAGGSITVYHVGAPGAGNENAEKRTKLYSCDPKESQSHPIPTDLVRGTTEVNLVAVIEQTAAYSKKVDRRHVRGATYKGKILMSPAVDIIHHKEIPEYKAVLFPSNSNTVEVFRLRCAIADPSPQLDKLFAANPEVLK